MKWIKNFKVFESNWNPEEFRSEVAYYLGRYNLTAIFIREVIDRYDIQSEIESGRSPLQLSQQIISDLDLTGRGTEGWPSVSVNKMNPDRMKYL